MARWEPGAAQRLQQAAMTLFLERGYDDVTVAEIAEQAGLTRRTFFNYFTDKREIFFSGAAAFRASVGRHLAAADPDLPPLDAAATALGLAGDELVEARRYASEVRAVIAGSTELQERDLAKTAAITTDLTTGLRQRGVPARTARLSAVLAVTAFTIAWDDAVDRPEAPFADLVRGALAELSATIASGVQA